MDGRGGIGDLPLLIGKTKRQRERLGKWVRFILRGKCGGKWLVWLS